jgi:outer membrane lipoprotein carrier protein
MTIPDLRVTPPPPAVPRSLPAQATHPPAHRVYARLPRRILIMAAAALLASLHVAGVRAAGAIEQMRAFVSDTRSARGEFAQRTLKSNGALTDASSGAFSFSRPGRFRWEVLRPFEQLMVADGEQVWFWDKDLDQVTVRKVGDAMGASPATILFGDSDLDKTFTLEGLGEREGVLWLEARPRSTEVGFELITIGLRAGLPEAMEVRDAFGRTTQFAFRHLERNPKIDAAQYRFSVPKGAEVVRQ